MIRKMIVKCLTDLLMLYPTNKLVVKSWVQGVVPLVVDSDTKCQEKVIEVSLLYRVLNCSLPLYHYFCKLIKISLFLKLTCTIY